MESFYNREIFWSLMKGYFLLQLFVALVWYFIYKLYKYDVKSGKLIFSINVFIYLCCNFSLVMDLKEYSDLRAGGVTFAFVMGAFASSIIATFLLVVEYFIIKLIVRSFAPNKTHNF